MENTQKKLEDLSGGSEECDAGYNEDGTFRCCSFGDSSPNTLIDDYNGHPNFFSSQEQHHRSKARYAISSIESQCSILLEFKREE